MIDVEEHIDLLRRSGRFESEAEVLEEAVQALLEKRPELRIELAIERYKRGDVSLNRAAEIAGQNTEAFKTTLADRGIQRDVGFLDEGERHERLVASFYD